GCVDDARYRAVASLQPGIGIEWMYHRRRLPAYVTQLFRQGLRCRVEWRQDTMAQHERHRRRYGRGIFRDQDRHNRMVTRPGVEIVQIDRVVLNLPPVGETVRLTVRLDLQNEDR